jgi:uncharacterized protein (TIGR02265 family)
MPTYLPPAWDAPLDGATYLREVPSTARIKGMFTAALVTEAKRRNVVLTKASEKYHAFLDYPLTGHMEVCLEAAEVFYPGVAVRRGLRRLGRGACATFLQSTIGRTVLGGWLDQSAVPRAMAALARAYPIAFTHPSPVFEVSDPSESSCVVRLTDFWTFLDSHQIGILEGVCAACGVRADVTVWTEGLARGEFLVSWKPAARPSEEPPVSSA